MRLDAHHHLWKYSEAEYPWIKPEWPIRKNYLPEDLQPLLASAGLDGSIAVQARQNLEETRWLLELADRQPFIKGVVGWVDLRSERVEGDLQQLTKNPKLVGVRHVVQDEPDDDFMLRADFTRGIGKLAQFNLTYDILIFPRQLPAAIELVKRFPEQPFVLDHIAKPQIKDRVISPWREQLRELAKAPNVLCKLSGMVTEANWNGWTDADFEPYLDPVFEAFGASRLMFGSDWPVCLLAGSYERVFGIVQNRIALLPATQKESILGGNAEEFYLEGRRSLS